MKRRQVTAIGALKSPFDTFRITATCSLSIKLSADRGGVLIAIVRTKLAETCRRVGGGRVACGRRVAQRVPAASCDRCDGLWMLCLSQQSQIYGGDTRHPRAGLEALRVTNTARGAAWRADFSCLGALLLGGLLAWSVRVCPAAEAWTRQREGRL